MALFEIKDKETENPSNKSFFLHTHNNYEILLFLEGDTTYIVDGKNYTLERGDIIIIRKHQLHRAYQNTSSPYKRIVINVSPEFFKKFNCTEYEEQFISKSLDLDNKISASAVKQSGIYNAIMRLKKYSNDFKNTESPICVSVFIEILYLLSQLDTFSKADMSNVQFTKVIDYINNSFTEDVTLDFLAENFFISKYYLCRLFKEKTGLTFHQYLTKKRFAFVEDLVSTGVNIGSAAIIAGFKSYPSFYRSYVNEYGKSPKELLV